MEQAVLLIKAGLLLNHQVIEAGDLRVGCSTGLIELTLIEGLLISDGLLVLDGHLLELSHQNLVLSLELGLAFAGLPHLVFECLACLVLRVVEVVDFVLSPHLFLSAVMSSLLCTKHQSRLLRKRMTDLCPEAYRI